MTDRELLELAAKAAGIDCDIYGDSALMIPRGHPAQREWNPLTDDGDALRLACNLIMTVDTGPCRAKASTIGLTLAGIFIDEDTCYQETGAATRRAIVRAAAEIGK